MDEFLDMLGQRIDLSEHRGYKGGLDTVHGQTGQHSVYQVLIKRIYYCEAQARIGKGWQSRRKASKLKALPRAYTKVGCHPPTHPPKSLISLN